MAKNEARAQWRIARAELAEAISCIKRARRAAELAEDLAGESGQRRVSWALRTLAEKQAAPLYELIRSEL